MKEHKENNHVHSCTICEDKFENITSLEKHIRDEHTIICQICEMKIHSNTELACHMSENHTYKCSPCDEVFQNKDKLEEHETDKHKIKCDACDATFQTNEQIEQHVTDNHGIICTLCDSKMKNTEELKKHIQEEHYLACNYCDKKFSKKSEMINHESLAHVFYCNLCTFKGNNEVQMEDHILEKNAEPDKDKHYNCPDKDKHYNCEDCTFKALDKEAFVTHFKENHSARNKKDIEIEEEKEEVSSLKSELKLMKSNFERLESMYHEALNVVESVKSEYEAKIILAHDNFRTVKAENEALKEKVDILFKLGRSYINNKTREWEKVVQSNTGNHDEIEVLEVVEETEDMENLHTWTQNKMRGFRRVDPSKPAAAKLNNQSTKPTNERAFTTPASYASAAARSPAGRSSPTPAPTATGSSTGRVGAPKETASSQPPIAPSSVDIQEDTNDSSYKGRYCHYFVNQGQCNFGTSCSCIKCMFSHPKIPGSQTAHTANTFLGPAMSPWNMMNPWMNQATNHFPTPWNIPSQWNMKMSGNGNYNQH